MRWFAVTAAALLLGCRAPASDQSGPCRETLRYRIGKIDARYNVVPEAYRESARIAAALWNDAAGREIIAYDEDASFTLNLAFDDRQKKVEGQEQIRSLLAQFEQLRADHDGRLSAYQAALAAVQGRSVTRQEYEAIEAQREALNATLSLQKLLRDQIETLNKEVMGDAEDSGSDRVFIQGEYRPGRDITIYSFSNREAFEWVLAHEFGHALSIDHLPDPAAVMHYIHHGKTDVALALSASDKKALADVCR